MATQVPGKAAVALIYGARVDRATATLPQTATGNLFSVTGGRVLLTSIIGEVTVVIQAQANAVKLQHTQAAVTTDLCATADINALAVGSLFGITGKPADAATVGAGVSQNNEMVLQVGTIKLNTAASSTGSIKWTVNYLPLDNGALLVAV